MTTRMRLAYFTAWLMFCHAYLGVGYALGPERLTSAPSFQYILAVASGRTWGWWFIAGAFFTVTAPHLNHWGSLICHSIASVPYLAFAVGIALGDLNAVTRGWGGPVLWATPVVLGHVVCVVTRFRVEHARRFGG
jgi:hypothetical protein